jgi:hypothetical protein
MRVVTARFDEEAFQEIRAALVNRTTTETSCGILDEFLVGLIKGMGQGNNLIDFRLSRDRRSNSELRREEFERGLQGQ